MYSINQPPSFFIQFSQYQICQIIVLLVIRKFCAFVKNKNIYLYHISTMKPEEEVNNELSDGALHEASKGDVIGDTAYSERFVLRILLKFSNLNSLKDEMRDESFEKNLCTLWDMSADKDVVEFLQKHNTLKLFKLALPVIESDRIIEVVLGILGNLCCQENVVNALCNMDDLMIICTKYIENEDSAVLIQVLRFINACFYVAKEEEVGKWLEIFDKVDYATKLNFILLNSVNKELLINGVENYITITTKCNTEKFSPMYYKMFVNLESFDALYITFMELINERASCETEEFERVLVVTLQVTVNFLGFDEALELYVDRRKECSHIVQYLLTYFEAKFVNDKEIDSDLVDILDAALKTIDILSLSECNDLDQFFDQSHSMWITCCTIEQQKPNENESETESSRSTEDERVTLTKMARDLKGLLSCIMCKYMECCKYDNFLKVLEKADIDIDAIVGSCTDIYIKQAVLRRTSDYRNRVAAVEDTPS